MIKVDTYKYIKDLHIRERKSIRQISREVGLSRQTIRKILYQSLEDVTTYKRQAPPPAPLRNQFGAIIRQWLLDDQKRPPKQRHNSQRIFERLTEEYDFTGGASTVRKWVREIKKELNLERIEAFLPLDHDPKGYAQCDWTPAVAKINGQDVVGEIFLLRFSYSKAFYIRFYPHQRQEAFFDAHEHAFAFFGGVPSQILYDNLKTAVKRVLVGRQREEQDAFLKFRAHHGFESQFCNVAKGNEKGIVEGLARYVKNHIFTPVPEFTSIEALNEWLEECCRKLNNRPRGKQKISFQDRFAEEKDLLRPLSIHTFDCCSRKEVKVNRFSLITFDKNQYSVPVDYVGRLLTVKGYVHEIRIYDKQTLVACYPRSYDSGQQYFKLEHYLKLLERKPRAVGQAKPVRQANLPAIFTQYHLEVLKKDPQNGNKQFVALLLLLRQYSVDLLATAIEKALETGIVAVDAVQAALEVAVRDKTRAVSENTSAEINVSPTNTVAPVQISRYQELIQGGKSA
ncbi:IS21 family transposase [Sporolituus thermophilus]|uniref:Transposase n=3 Tax=Sporolituus thermophilus DSM 23256 TaxID=1123285 RepID=A0A1G7PNV5_9FIRM|nr:IS21 family transposase [Sporolituus thermophilus]SDF87935.1 Transposase [Sporolituus thermophilus DSM 23256]